MPRRRDSEKLGKLRRSLNYIFAMLTDDTIFMNDLDEDVEVDPAAEEELEDEGEETEETM